MFGFVFDQDYISMMHEIMKQKGRPPDKNPRYAVQKDRKRTNEIRGSQFQNPKRLGCSPRVVRVLPPQNVYMKGIVTRPRLTSRQGNDKRN